MTEQSSPARPGRPPRTSRAEILEGARRIIDRDGWERLTIRRLASEVGVGATTIYHHVADREDLLIHLLNDHFDQTLVEDLPADPRERIVAAGVAAHRSLSAWPWAAEVLTTDGFIFRAGATRRCASSRRSCPARSRAAARGSRPCWSSATCTTTPSARS